MKIKYITREIRINQWIKNILIFFPLIFSGNILEPESFWLSLKAFLLFSLLASGVYVMNDILDYQQDILHEKKKLRPIAGGLISKPAGVLISGLFLTVSLSGTYLVFGKDSFALFAVYLILNVLYAVLLKKFPPADIILVAIFYLLRPVIGAVAIGVEVTNWLILTTFFAALYLVIMKRRAELFKMEKSGVVTRKNIDRYESQTLKTVSIMVLGTALVSYATYSGNFSGFFVLTTLPLVGLGMRSVLLGQDDGLEQFETPEKFIYTDGISLGFFLIWLAAIIAYHV